MKIDLFVVFARMAFVGAKNDPEASMWLNPQSWSVISGFASEEQGRTAMDTANKILNTPYGLKLLDPPYQNHYFDGALMHYLIQIQRKMEEYSHNHRVGLYLQKLAWKW